MYKINAKLKEYKYIIHQQKQTIIDMDKEILDIKHQLSVAEAKK